MRRLSPRAWLLSGLHRTTQCRRAPAVASHPPLAPAQPAGRPGRSCCERFGRTAPTPTRRCTSCGGNVGRWRTGCAGMVTGMVHCLSCLIVERIRCSFRAAHPRRLTEPIATPQTRCRASSAARAAGASDAPREHSKTWAMARNSRPQNMLPSPKPRWNSSSRLSSAMPIAQDRGTLPGAGRLNNAVSRTVSSWQTTPWPLTKAPTWRTIASTLRRRFHDPALHRLPEITRVPAVPSPPRRYP